MLVLFIWEPRSMNGGLVLNDMMLTVNFFKLDHLVQREM